MTDRDRWVPKDWADVVADVRYVDWRWVAKWYWDGKNFWVRKAPGVEVTA